MIDVVCCVDSRVAVEVVTVAGVGRTGRLQVVAAAAAAVEIVGAVKKLDCA